MDSYEAIQTRDEHLHNNKHVFLVGAHELFEMQAYPVMSKCTILAMYKIFSKHSHFGTLWNTVYSIQYYILLTIVHLRDFKIC